MERCIRYNGLNLIIVSKQHHYLRKHARRYSDFGQYLSKDKSLILSVVITIEHIFFYISKQEKLIHASMVENDGAYREYYSIGNVFIFHKIFVKILNFHPHYHNKYGYMIIGVHKNTTQTNMNYASLKLSWLKALLLKMI